MREKYFHFKLMVSDYWIKIVDQKQRAHGLRKRRKARAKEQKERTAKKSAQKEKNCEKSERSFKMDPPSLRCLLCDAFFFFWEGGDHRCFFFSLSLFFLFSLFLLFSPLRRRRKRWWCSFVPQSLKVFCLCFCFFFIFLLLGFVVFFFVTKR